MRFWLALLGRVTSDRIIGRVPEFAAQPNGGVNAATRHQPPWALGDRSSSACYSASWRQAARLKGQVFASTSSVRATGSGPQRIAFLLVRRVAGDTRISLTVSVLYLFGGFLATGSAS